MKRFFEHLAVIGGPNGDGIDIDYDDFESSTPAAPPAQPVNIQTDALLSIEPTLPEAEVSPAKPDYDRPIAIRQSASALVTPPYAVRLSAVWPNQAQEIIPFAPDKPYQATRRRQRNSEKNRPVTLPVASHHQLNHSGTDSSSSIATVTANQFWQTMRYNVLASVLLPHPLSPNYIPAAIRLHRHLQFIDNRQFAFPLYQTPTNIPVWRYNPNPSIPLLGYNAPAVEPTVEPTIEPIAEPTPHFGFYNKNSPHQTGSVTSQKVFNHYKALIEHITADDLITIYDLDEFHLKMDAYIHQLQQLSARLKSLNNKKAAKLNQIQKEQLLTLINDKINALQAIAPPTDVFNVDGAMPSAQINSPSEKDDQAQVQIFADLNITNLNKAQTAYSSKYHYDALFQDCHDQPVILINYPQAKQLTQDQVKELASNDGISLTSPAGQTYQFIKKPLQAPRAYLKQSQARQLPTETDIEHLQRLAITVINMIDNVAASSTYLTITSSNPFLLTIAQQYSALLESQNIHFDSTHFRLKGNKPFKNDLNAIRLFKTFVNERNLIPSLINSDAFKSALAFRQQKIVAAPAESASSCLAF